MEPKAVLAVFAALILFSVISAEAPCVNTIDTCYHHRKEDICVGIYKPWATLNCALYCGFCQGHEVCEDAIPNCYQYYQPCDNPSFFVWVADNCRKFCGRCGDVQGMTASPVTHTAAVTTHAPVVTTHQDVMMSADCSDNVPFCNHYSLSSCTERPEWARDFCPQYCGLCPQDAANCPDAWTGYHTSCYTVLEDARTWYNSKATCETLGGHLVEIENSDENHFVAITLLHERKAWIGLEDFLIEGTFVWATTGQRPYYTNWGSMQPDDSNGVEDCGGINDGAQKTMWNDDDCDHLKVAVCERQELDPFVGK